MRLSSFTPVLAALFVAVAGVAIPDDSSKRAVTNAELLRRGLRARDPRTGFIGASVGGRGGGGGIGGRNDGFLGFVSSDISGGARIDPNIENALCINFDTGDSKSGSELDIFATVCSYHRF